MIRVNEHYQKLASSYLFSDIEKRITAFSTAHPDRLIYRMGIGDVTRALPPACIVALHKAVDEMATEASFRGYGPEQGYPFLREAIARNDFVAHGADIAPDEIFVSDGAKCDTGNIQELFSNSIKIAVPDPVYPVYVDTNVMAGRTGSFTNGRYDGLVYLDSTEANGFVPELPKEKVDLIYLCFPNNPTGATITKQKLGQWVDYARNNQALILFDAAYEAFIQDDELPHSIYEIEGGRDVAIEFRSYSKTAGFTGTRCAYTVVPKTCMAFDANGNKLPLHNLWNRRHTTKFNGVSYPVQRAAEAVYSEEGKKQVKDIIAYYMRNAAHIRQSMQSFGFACTGGDNSPYIWVKCAMDSWDFFSMLLDKAGVVCTPGAGFGRCGSGYARFSAFGNYEKTREAMKKISGIIKKQ